MVKPSILYVGALVIVGMLLAYHEYEKHLATMASAATAKSIADSSVFAEIAQASELTNVPAGGALPANTYGHDAITEAPIGAFNLVTAAVAKVS